MPTKKRLKNFPRINLGIYICHPYCWKWENPNFHNAKSHSKSHPQKKENFIQTILYILYSPVTFRLHSTSISPFFVSILHHFLSPFRLHFTIFRLHFTLLFASIPPPFHHFSSPFYTTFCLHSASISPFFASILHHFSPPFRLHIHYLYHHFHFIISPPSSPSFHHFASIITIDSSFH